MMAPMSRRILIVDDDPNLRRTLADILHSKGYEPFTASAGSEAIFLASAETPVVALIDLHLEDMSGLEVLKYLKQSHGTIACVVLTGHASQHSAIEAINLGAYGYVQKPYDVDQLLLTIRRAIEKQEADAALHQSQALLRATGEIARVGGWELDAHTREYAWTDQVYAIHGVGRDYMPDTETELSFFSPESRSTIEAIMHDALTKGTPFDRELPFRTAGGRDLWVHIQGKAEYRDGRIIKVSGTFQDITDRKRAEVELRQTNQRLTETLAKLRAAQDQAIRQARMAAVGQLSSGLAHEYNNLMATIMLYSDMMLRTSVLSAGDRERISILYEQGRRAAELTQQLLDFSRNAILRKQNVDVGAYLHDLEQRLRSVLAGNITISVVCRNEALQMLVDPERVQQALINIALNARDAMIPEGGELTITAVALTLPHGQTPPIPELKPGNWVVLSIRDTGTGIVPEVLPHIFEPFFTTRAPINSGLGLSQVFGTVKQHRGYIDVQTEVGAGSTFSLYLPAMGTAILHSELVDSADHRHDDGRQALVIIEYDRVREALVAALESLDIASAAAVSFEAALKQHAMRSQQFRFIFTDVTDAQAGRQILVHKLKSNFPTARLVMIGDRTPSMDLRAMVRAGTIRWLEKPVDLAKLAEVLADIEFDQ